MPGPSSITAKRIRSAPTRWTSRATSPEPRFGVIDRVAREIPDRLCETVWVGVEGSVGHGTELEAAVVGQADAVPQILDERPQLDRFTAQEVGLA